MNGDEQLFANAFFGLDGVIQSSRAYPDAPRILRISKITNGNHLLGFVHLGTVCFKDAPGLSTPGFLRIKEVDEEVQVHPQGPAD